MVCCSQGEVHWGVGVSDGEEGESRWAGGMSTTGVVVASVSATAVLMGDDGEEAGGAGDTAPVGLAVGGVHSKSPE